VDKLLQNTVEYAKIQFQNNFTLHLGEMMQAIIAQPDGLMIARSQMLIYPDFSINLSEFSMASTVRVENPILPLV